jgi:hypothetical protein
MAFSLGRNEEGSQEQDRVIARDRVIGKARVHRGDAEAQIKTKPAMS